MNYEGKIYRPWPEAESVLIQTTLGCSNNKCTFCNMFRDKRFRIRPLDEVCADIDELRRYYPVARSVFLIDGNVMAARTDYLLAVLEKVRATFPECEQIALYASLNDIIRKQPADLRALVDAGVSLAYTGLESGDPVVLERIKKGMTREHVIEGMAMAKDAGLNVLLSFIFGLGGRHRSREHITATTELLNMVQPEEMAPMALAIQPGTELEAEVRSGEFVLPTPMQLLEEEAYLLENLDDFPTYYWGDHGNNVVPQKGWLPQHRELFLKRVQGAMLNHPMARQEELRTFAW